MQLYPSVAIVILGWNGKKYIEQFLPSVCKTAYPNLQIYVADNASTDGSVAYVKENFPEVKVIENGENNGFSRGYNLALQKVRTDYYVLLNQDVEVEPGWLEPVIELMGKDRQMAVCQPKIRAFHQPDYFEYAGAAGGWIDKYGYTFCRGRIMDTIEKDKGQYDKEQYIFWASGAAMVIKAKVYHELGGLDEYFFAHMEEIDLCWRIQNAGYHIGFCPAAVVYHVGGGSLPYGNPKKVFLNYRNNLVMLAKNLPDEERSKKIRQRMILDGVAAARTLAGGNLADLKAIVKAHREFKKWYRLYKRKIKNQGQHPFYSLSGVYKKSIVMDYFIKKKKTFRALNIVSK